MALIDSTKHAEQEQVLSNVEPSRRAFLKKSGAYATALGALSTSGSVFAASNGAPTLTLSTEWDKTFDKSDKVEHKKVSYKTRYGITLVADLYVPINITGKHAALAVSGPFGAVKEQSSGLYAQTMAERGFITLAFDPSYTGESSGEPRNVASPDINTEDFSASVDFLGSLPNVDRERIGVTGICGYSGMALTAATSDPRIKAVATASMYDMSRSMSRSYKDSYTMEERHKVMDYLGQQRWADVDRGSYGLGYHEVTFDDNGNIVTGERVLPDTLSANPNPVLAIFFDYYRTKRGFHPRGINSASAWTATTPMSFFSFPMYANIEMIAPRPVLLIAGDNAHSRYYSEDVHKLSPNNAELMIIPDADHVDLYDQMDKIPFDKLTAFFQKSLA
ncbi:alpha/beta hydrolase [Pseudoalteromonas sp. APC 3694]|uniref:alpha/beta hydrolase n=1 Tax=Pseudoalteromonas sp. APC 3694 TaxID=3035202 RepID=UPI0025B470C1|nr:alpha/beta hydrolase [Pseudoalteromonas sp. APC 3694]MDN3488648.1 alpha/beta hydrolase [Pseudoalteromonas sp. APC 3694]